MKSFFIWATTVFAFIFLGLQDVKCQTPDGDTSKSKVEYNQESKTFKSVKTNNNNDQKTSYLWEDSKGVQYPIWLHTYTKGENVGKVTCYVIRISQKTGKEYKYYLPDGMAIAEQILRENQ